MDFVAEKLSTCAARNNNRDGDLFRVKEESDLPGRSS